jgi:MFS family permease
MAIFSLGPLLGPIIGPIAGGYVSESLGWRWVFRILAIAVRNPFLHHLLFTLTPFPVCSRHCV